MKTIWKFKLKTKDRQQIPMPDGAEILAIQTQHGEPCLWALVDPSAVVTSRTFEIFGTGHPVVSHVARKHLGTYQLMDGDLVFHLFEVEGER